MTRLILIKIDARRLVQYSQDCYNNECIESYKLEILVEVLANLIDLKTLVCFKDHKTPYPPSTPNDVESIILIFMYVKKISSTFPTWYKASRPTTPLFFANLAV